MEVPVPTNPAKTTIISTDLLDLLLKDIDNFVAVSRDVQDKTNALLAVVVPTVQSLRSQVATLKAENIYLMEQNVLLRGEPSVED